MTDEVNDEQRYSIFVNAFTAYLATQSESYACQNAVATGRRLGIEELRAAEIGRDACDVCRREIGAFCSDLGTRAETFALRYLSKFQSGGRKRTKPFNELLLLAEDYHGQEQSER